MKKQMCFGLAVLLAVVLSTTPTDAADSDRCTEAPGETVHACAACASALQISMDLCCSSDTVLNFCQNLPRFGELEELEGNSLSSDESLEESKRGKYFLGKRNNRYLLGKRPRNNFLGKRGDERFVGQEDMLEDMEKRANPFLGKRANPFLGKRISQEEPLSDVLKRAKYFLGKKAKYFLGKRSDEMTDSDQVSLNDDQSADEITKRRQKYFLGK